VDHLCGVGGQDPKQLCSCWVFVAVFFFSVCTWCMVSDLHVRRTSLFPFPFFLHSFPFPFPFPLVIIPFSLFSFLCFLSVSPLPPTSNPAHVAANAMQPACLPGCFLLSQIRSQNRRNKSRVDGAIVRSPSLHAESEETLLER